MLPDLTILVALLLGLFALQPGPADPVRALGGTAACVLVGIALTWMAGERGVRGVRERAPRRALAAAHQIVIWPLLAWLGALEICDWGSLVANEVPRTFWILRYVVLLLPPAVLFAFAWTQRGRIEEEAAATRGVLPPQSGARAHIAQGLKRNGIALLPMLGIIGLFEAIWLLGHLGVPYLQPAARWLEAMPLLALGVMLGFLSLLTLFLPRILARVLPTAPLPPGRIRDLLEHQAAQLGLRYRDILVWKAPAHALNAMVVGVTGRTRIIFMTEALMTLLPTEQVLAVFCHEAGHAKRQHLPLFLVAFVATAILFHVVGDVLLAWGIPEHLLIAAHLAFLWFVLLGSVSRLFEREADVYGAEHAADLFPDAEPTLTLGLAEPLPTGTAAMMRALKRVEKLTGRGSSHRHGTIDSRVAYLARYATSPDVRARLGRAKRGLLAAIFGAFALAVLLVVAIVPRDLDVAHARIALEDGTKAYAEAAEARAEGRPTEALWRRAAQEFRTAIMRVEGRDTPLAEQILLDSRFNLADTVFHGLLDETEGRALFEALLTALEEADVPEEMTSALAFQAHVDVGRIAAHTGDPQALEHAVKAQRAMPPAEGALDLYQRARLALLRAVLFARAERVARAVAALDTTGVLYRATRHAFGDGTGDEQGVLVLRRLAERREKGEAWDELRRDVALELRLLGLDT